MNDNDDRQRYQNARFDAAAIFFSVVIGITLGYAFVSLIIR